MTADEAAPTPDVPDEAVEAAAHAYLYDESGTVGGTAQAILAAVLADPDARAALLAALGHTDCVSREEHERVVAGVFLHSPSHCVPRADAEAAEDRADEWRSRCIRAEQDRDEWEGSAEQIDRELAETQTERDRYREALERISNTCEPDPAASEVVFLLARARAVDLARAKLDGEETS